MKFKFVDEDGNKITRKRYANEDAYLEAVYNANKTRLDEIIFTDNNGVPLAGNRAHLDLDFFKSKVRAQKRTHGVNVRSALNYLGRTSGFADAGEVQHENIISGLRRYGKLQELSRSVRDDKGHFIKFDEAQLRWDSERKGYVYRGQIFVDIRESPLRINLVRI